MGAMNMQLSVISYITPETENNSEIKKQIPAAGKAIQ